MILAEKIQYLRKEKAYTQEKLAELCSVSRQSITKWEADIALPELEKIIRLSEIFQVSIDVLLKDDLAIDGVKEVHCCGMRVVGEDVSKMAVYEGVLIKESIDDENVLDLLEVNKVELWRTKGVPKYWTALYFTSRAADLPERLAKVMLHSDEPEGNWFVDFKAGNVKYIVFRNEVLRYTIGNPAEKAAVCAKCRELGIPDGQMQWAE